MAGLSGAGALMGMIFVSREDEGFLPLLACLVVMILNIVFTVKAANSIKTSVNRQTYANQPAYANPAAVQQPTFSDEIIFIENGKPVQ